MDTDKQAIPKFASFTARRPAPRSIAVKKERQVVPDPPIEDRARSDLASRDSRYGSVTDRTKRKHASRTSAAVSHRDGNGLQSGQDSGGMLAFTVDTKGDTNLLQYGGASRWVIPKYVRRDASRVLGTNARIRRSNVEGDHTQLMLETDHVYNDSVRTGLSRKSIIFKQPMQLKADAVVTKQDEDQDYINFGKITAKDDANAQRDIIDELRDFPMRSSSSDSGSGSGETGPTFSSQQHETLQVNSDLNRAVRTNADDVSAWLSLVMHQEAMLRLDYDSTISPLSLSQRGKLAEIRVAIYEDALKRVREPHGRERLWSGLLAEATHILEVDGQARKWQQAIKECPTSLELRLQQLNFTQVHYLMYGHDYVRTSFVELLDFIHLQSRRSDQSSSKDELCILQSYVFLRLTVFLDQTGCHELSFALWQSALDFLYLQPSEGSTALVEYSEFWDGESARLGETDLESTAKRDDTIIESPVDVNRPRSPPNEHSSPYRALALREQQIMAQNSLPGRISDLTDDFEDDAYHIIMASDIVPIIGTLMTAQKEQSSLLLAFLCFAGLPSLPSTPETCLSWWRDGYTHRDSISLGLSTETFGSMAPMAVPSSWRNDKTNFPSMVHDAVAWQPASKRRAAFAHIAQEVSQRVSHGLDMNVLHLVAVLRNRGVDATVKTTKKVLKADGQKVALYELLFILEQQRGNHAVAEKIIATPIRMRSSFAANAQRDLVQLWRAWIWHQVSTSEHERALQLLLSLDANDIVSHPVKDLQSVPAALLRSKQWLEQGLQESLHHNEMANFNALVEIGVLLSYFEHSRSLSEARAYLDDKLAMVPVSHPERAKIQELEHQSLTALMQYHAKHVRPYKPLEIQQLLQDSIRLFPHNGRFLEQYAHHELSFGHDHRLRGMLALMNLAERESLPRWLTTIWLELCRCQAIQGPQHSTRAILERAVESESGRYSQTLWMLFLQFEQQYGDVQRFRRVLGRALTRLPWCKVIVLEGLHFLDGRVDRPELEQLHALLEERDIRMMCSLADADC